MKIKVIVHEDVEGGYWAEVPAIPGCVSQGETIDEIKLNLHEAIEGCLTIELDQLMHSDSDRILELPI